MNHGRLTRGYESIRYPLSCDVSVSHSGQGNGYIGFGATLESFFAEIWIALSSGGKIFVQGNSESNTGSVRFDIPGDFHIEDLGAYTASVDAVLVFNNPVVYARAFLDVRLTVDSVDCIVGGSTVHTFAGFTIDQAAWVPDQGFAPSWLPIIGIPPKLSIAVTAIQDLGTPPDEYTAETIAEGTAAGGWSIEKASAELDGPVTIPSLGDAPTPAGDCPFGLSFHLPVADRTNSSEVSAYDRTKITRTEIVQALPDEMSVTWTCTSLAEPPVVTGDTETGPNECQYLVDGVPQDFRTVWKIRAEDESWSNSIQPYADMDKSIRRMESGHAQYVRRFGMPKVTALLTRVCEVDGVEVSASSEIEVYPNQAQISSKIGDSVHACEDTLEYPTYAPFTASYSQSVVETLEDDGGVIVCECPPSWFVPPACDGVFVVGCAMDPWPEIALVDESETIGLVFPYQVSDAEGDVLAMLWHDIGMARYWDTWCNPFYSYRNEFPANTIGDPPDEQEQWQVLGANIAKEYWMGLGDQWFGDSYLPPSERTESRTTLFSCPLSVTGWQVMHENLSGQLPWLGQCRFLNLDVTPLADFTDSSAQEDLYAVVNGALTFGASITVNADGAGAQTVEIRRALGSWTIEPFMWTRIARDVTITWVATNISGVRVYLEGIDDEKVLLGSTSGVTVPKLIGTAEEYAGTWAIDNGSGYFPDEGTDEEPEGISAASMADPERALAFQLLPGITGNLLIEIDVADASINATLNYPEFELGDAAWINKVLSRNNQALLYEDGPGVNFPQSDWYTPGIGFNDPPELVGRGGASTIVDAYCWANVLFLGLAYDDGLTAWIAANFDSYEATNVASVENSDSMSFLLPHSADGQFRFAICNTRAEIPPHGAIPHFTRDTNWEETTTFWGGVLSWAREKRLLITSSGELNTFEPKGTQWSGDETPPFDPWIITSHAHAVDNNEGIDHEIRKDDGTVLALVRPWHNFFAVFEGAQEEEIDGAFVHAESLGHKHCFAWVNAGGTVSTSRSPNTRPYILDLAVDTTIDADWVHLAYEVYGSGRLWMLVSFDGDIDLYESTDDGRTFTLATTVFTGPGYSHGADVCGRKDNLIFSYAVVPASNKIVGRIFDSALNELEAEFDAVASGVADKGIDVWERTINEGERNICISYINTSGSRIIVEANDGRAFS